MMRHVKRAALSFAFHFLFTSNSVSATATISSNSLHRVLANADDAATDDYFQYDLAEYSVRFEKCQSVKMYDDTLAQSQQYSSPFALKHFVIYRLCPSNACAHNKSKSSATSCDNLPHGVYTVDVESYLDTVTKYQTEIFTKQCEACANGNCQNDDQATACANYENLATSGYVDASQFIQCQQIDVAAAGDDAGGNGDDDDQNQVYIGPRCSSTGNIVIGLFSDAYCYTPLNSTSVETVLGAKLWYDFFKESYYNNGTCLSCQEDVDNENEHDAEDQDDVNEMCEDLYQAAAKCESDTGLSVGFVQTNREDGQFENQVENEFLACTFINSLIWNSYTQAGEINYKAQQDEIVRLVTQKQTVVLSILTGVILVLLGAIYFVDRTIKKTEPQNLSLKCDDEHALT